VKKTIQEFLVTIKQRVRLMRECKNHMEVRGVYDFGSAFVHPDFLHDCLTVGTVTVSTGIIVDLGKPTLRTLAGIASKLTGFAVQNGVRSFSLFFRLEMV